MKKALKLFFACLLCILSVVILYGLYAIVYPWITEYNPEETTVIIENQPMEKLPATKTFSRPRLGRSHRAAVPGAEHAKIALKKREFR